MGQNAPRGKFAPRVSMIAGRGPEAKGAAATACLSRCALARRADNFGERAWSHGTAGQAGSGTLTGEAILEAH